MDHDGHRRVGKNEEKGFGESCTSQTLLFCLFLFLSDHHLSIQYFFLCVVFLHSFFHFCSSFYKILPMVSYEVESSSWGESVVGNERWGRQDMPLDRGTCLLRSAQCHWPQGLSTCSGQSPDCCPLAEPPSTSGFFGFPWGWGAGGAKSPSHLTSPD